MSKERQKNAPTLEEQAMNLVLEWKSDNRTPPNVPLTDEEAAYLMVKFHKNLLAGVGPRDQ